MENSEKMKEQNAVTNEQAREAIDRILNFCEEIDNHIPHDETTGYKMLPDYFIVSIYLTEASYRKQEWISVEDRLPDTDEVLVYCRKGVGHAAPKKQGLDKMDWDVFFNITGTTHWMPLPEPPKKGGAE